VEYSGRIPLSNPKRPDETHTLQAPAALPYHSWERGLNENTNGLIHQYLPKGTDFRTLTLEKVRSIMDRFNNRPRKCLGFKTPNQLFSEINPPVALTS
jgi:IS30 family transposase